MKDIIKALGMSHVSFTGKEYEERNKQFVQLIIDNGCMKTYVKLIKLLSDKKLDTLALQLGNSSPKPTGLFDNAISPKSPKKTKGFQLTAPRSSLFGPPKKGFSFVRAEGFKFPAPSSNLYFGLPKKQSTFGKFIQSQPNDIILNQLERMQDILNDMRSKLKDNSPPFKKAKNMTLF